MDQDRIPSIISMTSIVNEALGDNKNVTESQRFDFMRWAIRGLNHINNVLPIHCVSCSRIYRAQLDAANMITLPPDYVNWHKVGYDVAGTINILLENDDIAIPDQQCNTFVNENTNKPVPEIIPGFGAPSGISKNDFKVFRRGDLYYMVFSNVMPTQSIYVEYFSTGIVSGAETYIDAQFKEPIIAFILWKEADSDPRVGGNEKLNKERQFKERLKELFYMRNTYTLDDIIRAFRKGYSQSPKG